MNMFSPKPAASLSSGLLARKGQAKPAMRRPAYNDLSGSAMLEDLGWNDMGDDAHLPPPVLRQREALAEEFETVVQPAPEVSEPTLAPVTVVTPVFAEEPLELRPVSVATASRISREVHKRKSKAAFTLRLDADRHLRLRLASAVRGQSSQILVTEALDAFFAALPEVDALARQVPVRTGR